MRHEIDGPCLKSIMISKLKIDFMTKTFSCNTQDLCNKSHNFISFNLTDIQV